MLRKPVLGVGWDVGGWLGQKQAVAVVMWENDSGGARWLGSARCFSIGSWNRGDWQIDDLVRLAWADAPHNVLAGFDVNLAIDAPLGGMPRPLLKFGGGSVEILRHVRH